MTRVVFVPATFRLLYPAFGNVSCYPDALLDQYFAIATVYINNPSGGCYFGAAGMTTAQLTAALNLMTAHLLALNDLIAAGQTPAIQIGATIDKISVTIQPPPETNYWQYWLQTTGYGQQLLALLTVASVGGFYATTSVPGRAGFQWN